ncbi:FHA domain-containing protein [Massilia sp. W12]|uniref:FHA domain-containing protein n=1 Tax=Massilia sp. W12 TaxID=3126507 RepID=UPI0030D22183
MAKIIISHNGAVLQEVTINKEKLKIGRHPKNDVVIDNRAISAEHAQILSGPKDVILEDLNSTNGTLVNGQPIKRHFLQDRDVIELAKYRIEYFSESKPQAKPLAQAAMVKVLNGANAGRVLILNKQLTTLGRPGQVAAITRSAHQYLLAHIEGDKNLFLNGNHVGREAKPLQNGDLIMFAGTEMAFIWA